ncbi:uracil-DNA glycosylase [Paenarthrobacter sp. AB444]|uniref:uracil-DNA glycosylase n=1 Tax=Paenarthrobacter sp. AB444 TaxID=3025681 RepID=UPI002365701C|nr:uracil-DNA glycosylase [Paenarthrobacter sp. AB444]MDD7836841.1 uracil-DNA glycosylase [Paenarthrobacter sp. AB444]
MTGEDALFDLEPAGEADPGFATLIDRPLEELMAPDWAEAMRPVEGQLRDALAYVARRAGDGKHVLPASEDVLRAFRQPLAEVKVLLLGQDPYPTPGHAVGLSFSVSRQTRPIPRSLANIYRELHDDLGLPPRVHGDLSAWTEQGVLLLNRVLTVEARDAGAHRGKGWEAITTAAVTAVVNRTDGAGRRKPLVAILWGKDAEGVAPLLGDAPSIVSVHPSPLSASRGFFGSKPFSRTNELLVEQGAEPVDWELPVL